MTLKQSLLTSNKQNILSLSLSPSLFLTFSPLSLPPSHPLFHSLSLPLFSLPFPSCSLSLPFPLYFSLPLPPDNPLPEGLRGVVHSSWSVLVLAEHYRPIHAHQLGACGREVGSRHCAFGIVLLCLWLQMSEG